MTRPIGYRVRCMKQTHNILHQSSPYNGVSSARPQQNSPRLIANCLIVAAATMPRLLKILRHSVPVDNLVLSLFYVCMLLQPTEMI